MNYFICPFCNTQIEVDDINDIVECPNCKEMVEKENADNVIFECDY